MESLNRLVLHVMPAAHHLCSDVNAFHEKYAPKYGHNNLHGGSDAEIAERGRFLDEDFAQGGQVHDEDGDEVDERGAQDDENNEPGEALLAEIRAALVGGVVAPMRVGATWRENEGGRQGRTRRGTCTRSALRSGVDD